MKIGGEGMIKLPNFPNYQMGKGGRDDGVADGINGICLGQLSCRGTGIATCNWGTRDSGKAWPEGA